MNLTRYAFDSEGYEKAYRAEVDRLWSYEVDDAMCQGLLKAHKELTYVARRGTIGLTRPHRLFWVTVNPKPGVTIEQLVQRTQKYAKSRVVETLEYTFEQRGANLEEIGKGCHSHMLVTSALKPSEFSARTISCFKSLVGSDHAVHIVECPKSFVDDKRAYMRGEKTADGKPEKVKLDKVWRRENNLLEYYTYPDAHHKEATSPSPST